MNDTGSLKCQDRDVRLLSAKSCRFAALVVLAWLGTAAAVVAARGFAGVLRSPLEPTALLTAGVLTAAAGVAIRLGWLLPLGDDRVTGRDFLVMASATVAIAAIYRALALPPRTSPEAITLLRLIFVAEEGWAWGWLWLKSRRPPRQAAEAAPTFRFDVAHPTAHRDVASNEPRSGEASVAEPLETAPPAEVTQQLTRSRAADGTEELFGWLRTAFAAGQRTASVHVAFCPPLEATPEVEVEQIDGPEARIKTAQLLPYGARFDLKLAAAAESPATVALQFMARTPPKR